MFQDPFNWEALRIINIFPSWEGMFTAAVQHTLHNYGCSQKNSAQYRGAWKSLLIFHNCFLSKSKRTEVMMRKHRSHQTSVSVGGNGGLDPGDVVANLGVNSGIAPLGASNTPGNNALQLSVADHGTTRVSLCTQRVWTFRKWHQPKQWARGPRDHWLWRKPCQVYCAQKFYQGCFWFTLSAWCHQAWLELQGHHS